MPRSDSPAPSRARLLLAALVLAAFAALLALRIHHWGGLDQTALFYVGLPATIALLVVFTVRARSAMGVTMAVTTLCLALAGPLLGEGMVCLLIAAPLIYGVVAVVTWTAGALVAWRDRSRHALFAVPLLFVLALEGVAGTSLLPREDRGEGHVLVPAAPHEVAAALAAPPAYAAPDVLFLRAVPFPEPVSASGEGLEVGDTRHVRFTPPRTAPHTDTPRHHPRPTPPRAGGNAPHERARARPEPRRWPPRGRGAGAHRDGPRRRWRWNPWRT
ncbi:hypothetical protein MRI28_24315 [Nocardiopsis dassonvillei]|uniref:hypothetical protein n=1 Tax=Nocardiopsis dassonvillei TaxID=2014 RepID=UPI00200E9FA3|nr:hypothetical protein [Nocardiopsis dassonvillei]MCK9872722.1 hypothetical protein [Nocardiopsis dassonvillei]